jgi:hypothetical protein
VDVKWKSIEVHTEQVVLSISEELLRKRHLKLELHFNLNLFHLGPKFNFNFTLHKLELWERGEDETWLPVHQSTS